MPTWHAMWGVSLPQISSEALDCTRQAQALHTGHSDFVLAELCQRRRAQLWLSATRTRGRHKTREQLNLTVQTNSTCLA
jgi:hypothetical protein